MLGSNLKLGGADSDTRIRASDVLWSLSLSLSVSIVSRDEAGATHTLILCFPFPSFCIGFATITIYAGATGLSLNRDSQ